MIVTVGMPEKSGILFIIFKPEEVAQGSRFEIFVYQFLRYHPKTTLSI